MELRQSVIASTLAHGVVVGSAMIGAVFDRSEPPEPLLPVTEVSVISSAEFDAMFSTAPEVVETPPPAPVVPEPEPQPVPEPPQPVVAPEPILAPPPDPTLPEISEDPTPAPAPRVAPEPAPPSEAEAAPVVEEAPEPTPEPAPVEPEPEPEPAAPEEATTEIVTEADVPSSAPANSSRPARRPNRPAPAPEEEPEQDLASAIASAVEEAQDAPAGPSGPPLTASETDVLRRAVQSCWNVGSLSSAALRTTVTISFEMSQDGTPISSSIRLKGSDGGDTAAANQSFEAGRRAILRCGRTGFDLPVEKYDHWRSIEMTFNPNEMRIR